MKHILVLLIAIPLLASAAPVAEFMDGDTVCFVGDSITKGGSYHTLIESFYATMFPNRRIRYYNCGVGGDRASAIVDAAKFRVDVDVLARKSTVATVMLGMNDVDRKGTPEQRAAALKIYEENLAKLVRALQAGGARVILLTPSIYDETAKLDQPALVGVNAALGQCAAIVRRIADQLHTEFVDVYTLMHSTNQREQAKNPAFSITGAGQNWNDRVHPGPVGHAVIAHAFLQAQGLVSGELNLSPSIPPAAEQRRRLGEQLRELATQRYAMAKEGLDPTDAAAFAQWLADKRAQVESKGQKAKWIELVQELLPKEPEMARQYDALSDQLRHTERPNEFLGAEYGAYHTAKDRAITATGKDAAVISLAGEWRCALDPDKKGVAALRLDKPIRLPGTLDEAGYGEPRDEKTLRCLSRRFEFIGPAWYQREIVVPPDWAGKRVTLTFERVMWESRVWIDDKPVGARDSLCTPHHYELTGLLTPGAHRLTVRVDNSGRPGANCHGYGDDLQIRWNGLLGRLELRAQDAVHVRSVQVYPDLAKKRAVVRVELGNIAGESFDGTVTVTARPKNGGPSPSAEAHFKIAGETLPLEIALPLGEQSALWDEFTPHLYEAEITVAAEAGGRKTFDRTTATFGLRELGKHGTQLTMNGRTLFLRGTHDGGGFPLTGYPAMDVAAWRKIFRTCKDYGLNHVRYHSFCPPDAAFTAADEEGMILQPELPVWGHIGADWAGTPFLRAELRRILDTYGNHPSFAMMSMGNEHSGDWDVLAGFVADAKRHDPRRKYAAASNQYIRMGKDPRPVNDGDEFAVIMRGPAPEPGYEQGRIRMMERLLNGEPPDFAADYRDIVKQFDVPVFAHELGQYWIFPDLRESAKYTGVLRSGALDLFRDSLAAAGLLDRAEKFHQASGALAVQLYKEDIERELRTPGLGGFQLLDLHDYTGQNTSLVGLLDAFWESKGIVTPAEFRRFCAPTVVLARMPKRVWTSDETLTAQFEVAHYAATPLTGSLAWRLTTLDGQTVANGTNNPAVVNLRDIAAPAQLRLEAAIGPATNDWNVWIYPKSDATQTNVRVTDKLDADTLRFIETGGRVLFLGHASAHTVPVDFPNPIWNPFGGSIQSCGLLIAAQHPALAKFPTATHADWQWRDLLEPEARVFVLNDLPRDAAPIVEVIDQPLRAFRLGVVFEARVGSGVLLATSLELDASVAGRQLRRSLLDYLASDRCQPSLRLTADETNRLLTGNRFQFAAPTGARVMLEVEPSANAPAENATKWKAAHDRVVKRETGFDYDFGPQPPSVTWKKNGKPAWMSRHFTLRLRCPANFTGTVHLQFRDADSGKAVGVVQSGGDACYVGPHAGEGKWVGLRVAPADVKDGAVELTVFKPAGGDSWSRAPRITRLVVCGGL